MNRPVLAARHPGVDLIARTDAAMARGAHAAALTALMPALRAGTAELGVVDRAASCFWHLGDAETAMSLMRDLLARQPGEGAAWAKLATMAAGAGQRAEARAALEQAMQHGVKTAQTLSLLDRLDPQSPGGAVERRLKSLADRAATAPADRALALNTLGRIAHRAGRHRVAFRRFIAAKAAQGRTYRPREITAMVAAQLRRFDPDRLPQDRPDMPPMLFVAGMPRSGTTLVERALARHGGVRAIGESAALSKTVMAMRRDLARLGQVQTAWDWFGTIGPDALERYRTLFRAHLPVGCAEDGRLIVSKMPLDLFDLGAARMLLPQARFVVMERHPLDTGLSNLMTLFHEGHGYATRLDWIGHMIRSVALSTEDYARKLGPDLRRQSYRALVTAPRAELSALLAHAGLDWDEACLHPEEGAGPVLTASLYQVRAPINRGGLDTWQPYRAQLEPLVEALGGWSRIAEWEDRDAGRHCAPPET